MTLEELEERNQHSREILLNSGAHFVIDSLNQLPPVIERINELLKAGVRP